MPGTRQVRNLFIPEVFNKYVIEENTNVNKLDTSGIAQADAEITRLAQNGGNIIHLPYFKNLDGADEVLSVDGQLTPDTVKAGMDICRLHLRGRAWKVSDLEKTLSGDDPMGALTKQIGAYLAEKEQEILLASLEGVFASADMAGNIYRAGGVDNDDNVQVITGQDFIQAKNLLGDNSSKLTTVIMHSASFAELEAQNLITYIPNSQGIVDFPTYMGKKVIVDDTCPYDAGRQVYTMYIFGEGAIARAEGSPETPSEIGRNHLSGNDELVVRRHLILHPRGVKFTSQHCAGLAPTNAELKRHENWEKVYDNKNIKIIAFKHKLA